MFRTTGLRQWKSFSSVRWFSDSHNSRTVKKPKWRPPKLPTANIGINRTSDVEGINSTRESTKLSGETSQETSDASLELKNKHAADQVAPFSLPGRDNAATKDHKEPSNRPRAKLTFSKKKAMDGDGEDERDRPFTLPSGKFKPIQSLGQNFLSDQNYVLKICDAFTDDSLRGKNVVEIGPGPGALTRVLYPRYPNMTAIEIDKRAVDFLYEKLPGLNVQHMDVLRTDWPQLAAEKGGCLNIIANLPYYIVSQVLFSLADSHRAVDTAVLTMQLEVAQRIVAKPSTKDYGIPSVVFQLYGAPSINFLIPPSVFYPKPKVESALLTMDFTKPHPDLYRVDGDHLRKILAASFQQRRKMLRSSLKDLLNRDNLVLDEKWTTKRPEELTPSDFVQMTSELYGENPQPQRTIQEKIVKDAAPSSQRLKVPPKKVKLANDKKDLVMKRRGDRKSDSLESAAARLKEEKEQEELATAAALAEKAAIEAQAQYEIARFQRDTYVTRPVWRMAIFGASGTKGFGMNPEEEKVEKERLEKKRLKKEARREEIRLDEKFFNDEDMEGEL